MSGSNVLQALPIATNGRGDSLDVKRKRWGTSGTSRNEAQK